MAKAGGSKKKGMLLDPNGDISGPELIQQMKEQASSLLRDTHVLRSKGDTEGIKGRPYVKMMIGAATVKKYIDDTEINKYGHNEVFYEPGFNKK
jgi:hypothetical protein